MGARKGTIQEDFVRREAKGPPHPSFVCFLLLSLSCFTSPSSSPQLQLQKQVCNQETQMDGFTRATYSDGSYNSPAPTFSPHPGHSPPSVGCISSLQAQELKTRKLLKPRSGNSTELDRSLRRFILNTFRSTLAASPGLKDRPQSHRAEGSQLCHFSPQPPPSLPLELAETPVAFLWQTIHRARTGIVNPDSQFSHHAYLFCKKQQHIFAWQFAYFLHIIDINLLSVLCHFSN